MRTLDFRRRSRSESQSVRGAEAGVLQRQRDALEDGSSPGRRPYELANLIVGGVILVSVFTWAYWPTLVRMVQTWEHYADYSHGYLVAPLAIFFLWLRYDDYPGKAPGVSWAGLGLIAVGVVLRVAGARYFLDAADAWSILFWIAGAVWLFWGRQVFWWSSPAIAFLFFMIPLPWRVERALSLPLQRVATQISCWVLQCLGQPALGEGNTILLGDQTMEVEEACCGLRIFMGIFALAVAYLIIARPSWWEKLVLLASVIPVALVANATRIVVTGILYQHVSEEAAEFAHDMAGLLVMIPLAAALFALVLWYLGKLMRQVEVVNVRTTVRREPV